MEIALILHVRAGAGSGRNSKPWAGHHRDTPTWEPKERPVQDFLDWLKKVSWSEVEAVVFLFDGLFQSQQ